MGGNRLKKQQIAGTHVSEHRHLSNPPKASAKTCPQHDHVWGDATKLMDRLGLDVLVNPCSMACSSAVTITPCACCHPAVLCLQSYSVHLSDAIYGRQFVVCHGSCSFFRTFFLSVFVKDGRGFLERRMKIEYLWFLWSDSVTTPFFYISRLHMSPVGLLARDELSPALFDTIKANECNN